MKKKDQIIQITLLTAILTFSLSANDTIKSSKLPKSITIHDIALNPEGIEYDKNRQVFLLSSLNAMPITQVNLDGTYRAFSSGEKFPLSTAGIQVDYPRNRLLVAGFNGTEIMDKDPKTKGVSILRSYNLKTGLLEEEVTLSALAPDADAYFANDIAVDNEGNVYVSDWYAGLIYRVNLDGNATIFWKKGAETIGGPNGLDFHPDGYLLVSLINVNDHGIYDAYQLVKIPLDNPKLSTTVNISDSQFAGFDGMVVDAKGDVVGVTNDQKSGGGNRLIKLSSQDGWRSANVVASKVITPSTTVAITPQSRNYVINQDFLDNLKKSWRIEEIELKWK